MLSLLSALGTYQSECDTLAYLSTSCWLIAANTKHSVVPLIAISSTYTQYHLSNVGPVQNETKAMKTCPRYLNPKMFANSN